MNLIKKLRDYYFNKNLKKDLLKFQRVTNPFKIEEVNTVGVLYHFADEETDKLINEFVTGMRDNNRKVQVLGLFDEKYIPHYYIPKLTWFVLNPRTVSWYYKPKAPFAISFCEEEFDLLIDLTLEEYKPLLYAGALSRAHFKVGRYSERNAKYYDLMIHTEQVETLPEFIEHVKHYISKVNR